MGKRTAGLTCGVRSASSASPLTIRITLKPTEKPWSSNSSATQDSLWCLRTLWIGKARFQFCSGLPSAVLNTSGLPAQSSTDREVYGEDFALPTLKLTRRKISAATDPARLDGDLFSSRAARILWPPSNNMVKTIASLSDQEPSLYAGEPIDQRARRDRVLPPPGLGSGAVGISGLSRNHNTNNSRVSSPGSSSSNDTTTNNNTTIRGENEIEVDPTVLTFRHL